jgi:DNA-binding NarL/FixJ family response regulator
MRPLRRASDPLTPDRTRKRLSRRELAAALLVADGLDDATIAGRLGLSPNTVALSIRRIRLRLGLTNRADLVTWVNARRDPDSPATRLRRLEANTTG